MSEAKGLLVNHRGERCGVYQFGRRLEQALGADHRIDWHYIECGTAEELLEAERRLSPELLLINHYRHHTMPWLTDEVVAQCRAPAFSMRRC